LGWIKRPESSRVAATALNDVNESVRAAACSAVFFLPGDEPASVLIPVLSDKQPFVRQEAAFALGKTHSHAATKALLNTMQSDRYLAVRTATAVALGQIGDPAATASLASALKGVIEGKPKDKSKTELEFLRRAAAVALGQMGDRAGVPELIAAISRETEPSDVRREAARALGVIGDSSSTSALRSVLQDRDPYLSQLAQEALDRIRGVKN
jgi:HEAT repeat protein